MRRIDTAPMEVVSPINNGSFKIEPYEAGWAIEAIAMVYVQETCSDSPILKLWSQISVDGQR